MATSITNTSVTTDNLTVDTNVLHVDSTNNRVGIGTASPAATLTVAHASGTDGRGIRLVNSSNNQTYENRIGTEGIENTSYSIRDMTADVVRFSISNTGVITKPSQPAFHIQGTGVAHTASQETAVVYASTPTIKFNVGNHGVGGTDPATSGKFTCPASGMYLVCCTWYRGGTATAYMGTIVKKNGAGYYSYWYNNASNYGDASVGQTAMIQCSANDVLQQYVYGNSSDSTPGTTMQIYFLG